MVSYWRRRNYWRYFGPNEDRNKVKVDQSEDHGKGLFAKQTIQMKDYICYVGDALLVALDTPRLKDTCYTCYTPENDFADLRPFHKYRPQERGKTLRACTGCGIVKFCSDECSKEALGCYHDDECEIFQRLSGRVPPNNLRAVLRFLLLRSENAIDIDTWRGLLDCQSHVDDLRKAGGKRWEDLCILTQCALEYSGTTESFDTVLKIFCTVLVNSVVMTNAYFQPIGIAMHPLMAKVNHNCDPNAIMTFTHVGNGPNDTKMTLIPLRSIQRGEEITVCYMNPTAPVAYRRQTLKTDYFFDCNCSICVRDLDSALPENTLKSNKFKEPFYKTLELIESANHDTSTSGRIQKFQYAVHLLLGAPWPVKKWPFPLVLESLISAYIDEQQYTLAFAFALIQYIKGDAKSIFDCQPVKIGHLLRLVELLHHIMEAENWAAQKLDLVPRKLPLAQFQRYFAWKAQKGDQKCASFGLLCLASKCQRVRGHLSIHQLPELKNKEKRELAVIGMNKLMDDVLDELRVWKVD